MIDNLILRFGSSVGSVPLQTHASAMVVFVGPNNSGKSLVLREIEESIRQGINHQMYAPEIQIYSSSQTVAHHKILQSLVFAPLPERDVLDIVLSQHPKPMLEDAESNITLDTQYYNFSGGIAPSTPTRIHVGNLLRGFTQGRYNGSYYPLFASLLTIRLDGNTRLTLTNPMQTADLQGRPQNHLMALFKDANARKRIREITFEAFGLHFTVDATAMQQFRVRMSRRAPEDVEEEESVGERGRNFHQQATLIEELSDGVKAFTGLTAAVFSSNYKVILIDEPEAFLHPPLARKLGKVLTQTASEREGNVFASTHSADFLMGCIQASRPVDVVRLTYQKDVPTARILPGGDLRKLMNDPLLRSTGVLNALFHEGAVVCEADRDRAFYEEVNERLTASEQGIRDTLFLNATNKQTIQRIIKPLRQMGIPAAAIVDLDVIKEADLTSLLRAAHVPNELVTSWGQLKKRVIESFGEQHIDIKRQGVGGLDRQSLEVANNLLASCAEYGVFLVRVGEVERWLSNLGVSASKEHWLSEMFVRMGSDPTDAAYIRPSTGDVWDFIRQIARWIADPNRKGIPD